MEGVRDFAAAGDGMSGFLDKDGLGDKGADPLPDERKIDIAVTRPHYTAAVADKMRELLASQPRWKGVTLRSGF